MSSSKAVFLLCGRKWLLQNPTLAAETSKTSFILWEKEICMQVQSCCLPEEIAREIQNEECQFALCWHSFKPLLSEVVIYMHSWTNPHNNTNVPERKTKIHSWFSLLKNNTCIQSSNPSLLLLLPLFLSLRRWLIISAKPWFSLWHQEEASSEKI